MFLLDGERGEAAVLQKRVCVYGVGNGLKVPKSEACK